MGYTHYWDHLESFTDTEWEVITDKIRSVVNWCEGNGIPLRYEYDVDAPAQINDSEIRFNGEEQDGHETFMIKKVSSKNWDFCKTAGKPYDIAVGCCLIILNHPNKFKLSSDGDYDDWQDVIEVYEKIFGEKPVNFLRSDS